MIPTEDALSYPLAAGPACELLAWLIGRPDGGRLAREPNVPLPAVPAIY